MVKTKQKESQKRFTPPKLKVPKRDFDNILGKLIESKPEKRSK